MGFKYKQFVFGCLVGSMLVSGAAVASNGALANVLAGNSKIIVNQVDKTTKNNLYYNGNVNVPSSLMYEGTTYIPIRMLSDMLNTPISWDGKNKAVLVGSSVYNGKYLTDVAPSKISNNNVWINDSGLTTIDGQRYSSTIGFRSAEKYTREVSYSLNSQYKSFTFTYGNNNNPQGNITVYGDGVEIWSGVVVSGVKAQDVKIDIDGIMSLTIQYEDVTNSYESRQNYVLLANPFVSK
jgi:hypothetical protein